MGEYVCWARHTMCGPKAWKHTLNGPCHACHAVLRAMVSNPRAPATATNKNLRRVPHGGKWAIH